MHFVSFHIAVKTFWRMSLLLLTVRCGVGGVARLTALRRCGHRLYNWLSDSRFWCTPYGVRGDAAGGRLYMRGLLVRVNTPSAVVSRRCGHRLYMCGCDLSSGQKNIPPEVWRPRAESIMGRIMLDV